jgi:uncharacterized protein (TIGR04255 family)
VEVVFGAAFVPVQGITVAHLGGWWEILGRSKYPTCEEQPPLGQLVENFGVVPAQFEFGVVPTPRVWFVSKAGEQVVQIQRDRFLCNWRKTPAQQVYPRYGVVSSTFFRQLAEYQKFVLTEVGGDLSFTQFELTYINHVVVGAEVEGIGGVLPDLAWRPNERFLPPPDGVEARLSFVLPDKQTRLHATITTGRRRDDNSPVLIVDLTARGLGPDLSAWFASAHEWIVRGFADLTSGGAHRAWGRVT